MHRAKRFPPGVIVEITRLTKERFCKIFYDNVCAMWGLNGIFELKQTLEKGAADQPASDRKIFEVNVKV